MRLMTHDLVELLGTAKLVFVSGQGCHRFAGRIRMDEFGELALSQEPGPMRLVREEPESETATGQLIRAEEVWPVMVHDVSVMGMGVYSNIPVMRGTRCRVRVPLKGAGERERELLCVVRRCDRLSASVGGLLKPGLQFRDSRNQAWEFILGLEFEDEVEGGLGEKRHALDPATGESI